VTESQVWSAELARGKTETDREKEMVKKPARNNCKFNIFRGRSWAQTLDW